MELLFSFSIICIGLLRFGNSRYIPDMNTLDVTNFGDGKGTIDVTKFGALGDGKNDDSQAFLKAWENACGASDSQTLLIPQGKSFLLQPLVFNGPCKSTIHVELQGTLVGSGPEKWSGKQKDRWIVFHKVDNLIFKGSGKIDGYGEPWWKFAKSQGDQGRPTALAFQGCNNLQVKGFTSINSPRNHISISDCKKVSISNLNLIAPDESPNTDGIDIASSSQVNILDSFIGTGDDCVAINGGNVGINIKNVICGPGHGLSIGSLGRNGARDTVEQVQIQNCTFNRTQNGARIKTWPGGSGYVKNVQFEKIILIEAKNPIIIDQYYGNCYPNCLGGDSVVKVSNVEFREFQGTSANEKAIQLNCHADGCNNIVLEKVNIQSALDKNNLDVVCKNAQVTAREIRPSISCSSG